MPHCNPTPPPTIRPAASTVRSNPIALAMVLAKSLSDSIAPFP